MVIFSKLSDATMITMNDDINVWLESLGSKTPTPGGGAVAALSSAISAAQLAMVANYTTGKKFADAETRMQEIAQELTDLREQSLDLIAADAKAFSKIGAAYSLPKETSAQEATRRIAIQSALLGAAEPPTKVATIASRLVKIADELAVAGNKNVISDVAVGASLAKAALESAIVNIEINKTSLKNQSEKNALQIAIDQATKNIANADRIVQDTRKHFA